MLGVNRQMNKRHTQKHIASGIDSTKVKAKIHKSTRLHTARSMYYCLLLSNKQTLTHETMNCRANGFRVRMRSCSSGRNVIRSKLALSVTISYKSTHAHTIYWVAWQKKPIEYYPHQFVDSKNSADLRLQVDRSADRYITAGRLKSLSLTTATVLMSKDPTISRYGTPRYID